MNASPSARTPKDRQAHQTAAALLTYTTSTAGRGIIRYAVSGTVDATTCGSFSTRLDAIAAAARPFILDLTGVPFVSVGGLTHLETFARTASHLDIHWALAAEHSLHRFLTLLNMDAHIPSFDTEAAALAHLTNTLDRCRQSN